MFVETYYDERSTMPSGASKPAIPYPELVGEELRLWQEYLPVTSELKDLPFWLQDNMPHVVMEQLDRAQKTPSLFQRIEIWTRPGDPMAVGVMAGEPTRYFSIARWGDANLRLEQVKSRLRAEKWLFRLLSVAMMVILFVATFTLVMRAGALPDFAQQALTYGNYWQGD
jgi:hypothetical protein